MIVWSQYLLSFGKKNTSCLDRDHVLKVGMGHAFGNLSEVCR